MDKWIGVDLDGTLAQYDEWEGVGVIGEPIRLMQQRILGWLDEGKTVKICTARVGGPDDAVNQQERQAIEEWCKLHLGRALEVTCKKDWGMEELWDDRAIQVVKNTGLRADGVVDSPAEVGDIGGCL